MSEQSVDRFAWIPASLLGTRRKAATAMRRIARRAWRRFDWQSAIEQEQLVEFINTNSAEVHISQCYFSASLEAWRLYSWDMAMSHGFEHGGKAHDKQSPTHFDDCITFILSGMQHLWYTLATLRSSMQPIFVLRFVAAGIQPAISITRREAEDFAEMLRWYVRWLPEILALKDRLRPTNSNFGSFILVAATRSCGVKFTADELQYGDAASLLLERGIVTHAHSRFVLTPSGRHIISPAEEAALFPYPETAD